ncbi:MAG: hypothetical protein KGL39_35145 [Patescibacteria group bacterium]|nr:hypothetical protein [Patescibacteria group bacterium]
MGEWMTTNFLSVGHSQVCVYIDGDGSLGFDPTDPAGMLSTIATMPPTYAALSALPCASPGWQKIFDQWKAENIVS